MDLRPVAGSGSPEPQTSHSGDSTPNPLAGESSGGGAAAGSRKDKKAKSKKHMDVKDALKALDPLLEAIAAVPWVGWGWQTLPARHRMPCNSRKRSKCVG